MSIKKEHEQVFTRLYGPNGLANYCNETFKLPPILQSRRALESKLQMRSEKKIVQLSVPHLKSCHEVSQSPTIKETTKLSMGKIIFTEHPFKITREYLLPKHSFDRHSHEGRLNQTLDVPEQKLLNKQQEEPCFEKKSLRKERILHRMFERMKISKGTLDKLKTPVYGQRQYDHKQSRRELFDTSKLVSYDMEMKESIRGKLRDSSFQLHMKAKSGLGEFKELELYKGQYKGVGLLEPWEILPDNEVFDFNECSLITLG